MFLTLAFQLVSPWKPLGLPRVPSSCMCSLSSTALPVSTLQTDSSGGPWFHHLPVVGLRVSSIRWRHMSHLHHRLIWQWNDFWYVGNLKLCSAQSQLQTHLFSIITLILLSLSLLPPERQWALAWPWSSLSSCRENLCISHQFLSRKHWKLFSI